MIKCEIILGGYVYDATNDLVNWDDVEMKWKRNDFDGVVRSFTTKFEFAGSTYSLLVSEFIKNMLNASASIVFYTRNNSWLWNERFRCALDFSTFSYNGNTCEINAIDDTLAAKIKANMSTKYEYLVDEIKDSRELDLGRLTLQGSAKWITPGLEEGSGNYYMDDFEYWKTIDFYVEESDILRNTISVHDCPLTGTGTQSEIFSNCYILENISLKPITVKVKLNLDIGVVYGDGDPQIKFVLVVGTHSESTLTYTHIEETPLSSLQNIYINKNINIPSGSRLWIYMEKEHVQAFVPIGIRRNEPLSIEYSFRYDNVTVPVISPNTLLNRLLKSINNGYEGITGEILNQPVGMMSTVILASGSIKGISGAKIYTSYKDFKEWMFAVFGFVPVIGDNKVSFVHIDTLYTGSTAKFVNNIAEFELSLDASMVHSSVKVGYNKQDYDDNNGRYEFRFNTEYSTGISLTGTTLKLISPYRADAYGIEYNLLERLNDDKDTGNDNDVFFVMINGSGSGNYILDYSSSVTGIPSGMYNGRFAALFLIMNNLKYLGSITKELQYVSSDGYSDVSVDGYKLNSDINTGNPLFLPARVTFTTEDSSIPSDLSGYISFNHQGKRYQGYVSEITLNIGRQESVKYELIVKSITDA